MLLCIVSAEADVAPEPAASDVPETAATFTSGETTTTLTVPAASAALPPVGTRLMSDFRVGKGGYSAVFRAGDFPVEVSAYGVSVRVKPLMLKSGDVEVLANVSDLRYGGEDRLVYEGVFGGENRVEYQLEERRLKESIIFDDIDDFMDEGSLASSTVSVDFSLLYPGKAALSLDGKMPWNGETIEASGDIHVIRRKIPGRLYPQNRFFRIIRPFAMDSDGNRVDLNYTLNAGANETRISLNLPSDWLRKARYPVTVDPTFGMDGIDGWYRYTNTRNCSTAAKDCSSITDTPYGNDVLFKIYDGCASSGDALKDIFEFNLESLEDDYDGDLDYAIMHFYGDCYYIDTLPNSYTLAITQVDPYVDSSPHCSDDPFGNYRSDVYELYGEGTGYSCRDGDRSVYVTSIMQDALDDDESHLAFKLDMDPPNNWNDDPVGSSAGYYISRYSDDLYIDYQFTCYDSGDCPSDEFCLDSYTDICWADYPDGYNCEDKATDNDDYACVNGVCEYDGFDGAGYFCSDGVKCVSDYELFDYGIWHCEGSSWAKQCGSNGDWGSQTNCDYGCDEGTGCATTTTTSTTTSTTTTTTLAPNIQITPNHIIITVIK